MTPLGHLTLAIVAVGVLAFGVLIAVVALFVRTTRAWADQARRTDDLVDRLEAAGVIDLSDTELVRRIVAARDSVAERTAS